MQRQTPGPDPPRCAQGRNSKAVAVVPGSGYEAESIVADGRVTAEASDGFESGDSWAWPAAAL